jgi:hypothetical protein
MTFRELVQVVGRGYIDRYVIGVILCCSMEVADAKILLLSNNSARDMGAGEDGGESVGHEHL